LKKYGNTLGSIFDEPTPKGYENELIIVNRIYESQNPEDLQKLAQNIDRYQKIRGAIVMIYAPTALRKTHLALLNSLSDMIEGIRGMSIISTDPVGATKMILRYDEGLKTLELVITQIDNYFKKQNIVFSSTEPGYIFVE
jgi:hypothetical protein